MGESTGPSSDLQVSGTIFRALAEARWSTAIELAEAHWAELVAHNIEVVRAVADALPQDVLDAHPRWIAVRTSVRTLLSNPSSPEAATAGSGRVVTDLLGRLVRYTSAASRARADGHFADAGEQAMLALTEFSDTAPQHLAELRVALPPLLLQWGLSLQFAVNEAPARKALELAFAWSTVAANRKVAIAAAGALAWIHAFAGRTASAESWVSKAAALERRGTAGVPRHSVTQLATAHLLHDVFDDDSALVALDYFGGDPYDDHRTIVAAARAAFEGQRAGGSPPAALAALEAHAAAQPAARIASHLNREALHMSRALLLLLDGKAIHALTLLDELVARGSSPWIFARRAAVHLALGDLDRAEMDAATMFDEMHAWPRFTIEAATVRAAVLARRGRSSEAAAAFRDAIAVAHTQRLPIALAIVPQSDFDTLRALVGSGPGQEALELVSASAVPRPPVIVAGPRPTPQELRVLELINADAGIAIADLAARLVLSPNTIKSHLRSLFRKAGAGRRSELLLAARRLDWL